MIYAVRALASAPLLIAGQALTDIGFRVAGVPNPHRRTS